MRVDTNLIDSIVGAQDIDIAIEIFKNTESRIALGYRMRQTDGKNFKPEKSQ